MNSASCASLDANGTSSPCRLPGQPRPSQCSYALPKRLEHRVGEPELLPQRSCHRGVVVDHPVDLPVAGERELEADPEAMERRIAGAEQAHPRRGPPDASRLMVVLARLERDVVAEPLRLLVG